jgi:hypothetical protein
MFCARMARRHLYVLVHAGGFEWNGRRYRSLTMVAREITGAHWSGPRFFGLRKRAGRSVESAEGTMLRGAVLPRCLGSGTIQTRRSRLYPTPASGWNRNEQGGGRGRLACNWNEIFCKHLLICKHAWHMSLASV